MRGMKLPWVRHPVHDAIPGQRDEDLDYHHLKRVDARKHNNAQKRYMNKQKEKKRVEV